MQIHHTGYAPDSVAVIGSGGKADGMLQKRLQRAGFRVQLLSLGELDKLRPGAMVVNAICLGGSEAMDRALETSRRLAAEDTGPLVHISSYRVFPGGTRKRYDEEDEPAPTTDQGEMWLACEEALRDRPGVTILRFGWLVDRSEQALLGRILKGILSGKSLQLDDSSSGSPVTLADLCRVVVAVVQQLASGAPESGVYHYGAADACTALEFGREVLERAQSFYDEDFGVALEPAPGAENRSAVLASEKLRDVFGIQQRSWRQGLTRQVELWLERLGGSQ
ncbi:dTDP-4-dehydrorhamnose reductase [Microbulbifer aggregans]|uniref:dTDP-4-dehydrorhamnose reductase n=1 Tax=Microbulbifer aggregans TaxID=1769779 RepID=A0A1C9W6T6_9GAMM|nr:sugar nucleotide-binding protein [Microbulbifer aggregans]AOS96862.1 dTDP-4-dehydrorhamnose reductase [Microbulbifer aggregans]